jgi:hypothetical protein
VSVLRRCVLFDFGRGGLLKFKRKPSQLSPGSARARNGHHRLAPRYRSPTPFLALSDLETPFIAPLALATSLPQRIQALYKEIDGQVVYETRHISSPQRTWWPKPILFLTDFKTHELTKIVSSRQVALATWFT